MNPAEEERGRVVDCRPRARHETPLSQNGVNPRCGLTSTPVHSHQRIQPHFGQASTLVPFVSVMADAVFEPSALITKISLLTRTEHGELRGVRLEEYAEKPINALSDDHIAALRDDAASPLFLLLVTRVTAPVSRVSE